MKIIQSSKINMLVLLALLFALLTEGIFAQTLHKYIGVYEGNGTVPADHRYPYPGPVNSSPTSNMPNTVYFAMMYRYTQEELGATPIVITEISFFVDYMRSDVEPTTREWLNASLLYRACPASGTGVHTKPTWPDNFNSPINSTTESWEALAPPAGYTQFKRLDYESWDFSSFDAENSYPNPPKYQVFTVKFSEPISYGGNQDLEFVIVKNGPGGDCQNGYCPVQLLSLWAYRYCGDGEDCNQGIGKGSWNSLTTGEWELDQEYLKPHIRLTYSNLTFENLEAYAGNKDAYKKGEDELGQADLGFSFDMFYVPEYANNTIHYEIQGPLPDTTSVYIATIPNVTKNMGEGDRYTYSKNLYDVRSSAVITGLGAVNGGLDINLLQTGQYRLMLTCSTDAIDYNAVRHETQNFYVTTDDDLGVTKILEPRHLQSYTADATQDIKVLPAIANFGANPKTEFYARAFVYRCAYNFTTGKSTRLGNALDTLPHLANDLIDGEQDGYYHYKSPAGQQIKLGDTVLLDERHLAPYFSLNDTGYYEIEVRLCDVDPNLIDNETSNDSYPRAGQSHVIRIQDEIVPEVAISQITPAAGFQTSLGKTVTVTTGLTNNGLLDISEKSGIYLKTRIYKYTNNVKGAVVWDPPKYVVRRGGANEGQVIISCVDDQTMEIIGWTVNESGRFLVETVLEVNNIASDTSSREFTVSPGLAGTFHIGEGRDFETINEVIDILNTYGVSDDCVFELTDSVYNEKSWTEARPDWPALDFRGKIPGVYEYRMNTAGVAELQINTITFVPSGVLANSRGSISINLESQSGYGMWFGAADNDIVHPNAMINIAAEADKRQWNQSDGYITWDGGAKKSFRIRLKAPAEKDIDVLPIKRFRAPIFMSNARNITIKNCIIEDGVYQPESKHYLIPGNSYNGPELRWTTDYEENNGVYKTYSAGVAICSRPPIQVGYQENRYKLDTIPCYNIVLSDNEITKFSYGILNIGLNYKLAGTPFLIDVIDTLHDVTRYELDNNPNLQYVNQEVISNIPAGGTTSIRYYRERSLIYPRANMRFWKHYTETVSGVQTSYTTIIDTADAGTMRLFNYSNLFENNLIYDIGRAGIFMGNDENSIIRGNVIRSINGHLVDGRDNPCDAKVDCAGILLGGIQQADLQGSVKIDGYMVVGTEIYKNEISNIASECAISGIKLEQAMLTDKITTRDIRFPDRTERLRIYSNMIWGFEPRNSKVNRYGINLSIGKRNINDLEAEEINPLDTMYYSTADDTYFISDVLIANNTVVMQEDGWLNTEGDYFGLKLQKLKNSRIVNNAVEMGDSTQSYLSVNNYTFSAGAYYQGPTPAEANNTIDYNVYAIKNNTECAVDVFCYALTSTLGSLLDEVHRGEYKILNNWQNWVQSDLYSSTRSFASDLVINSENKLRFRLYPPIVNSPLDKRGIYLQEAETDIDGQNRNYADQRLDIGAQLVNGTKLASDVEVLNIYEPATYKSSRGPLSDAEYFMIEDESITVRALVRNNGSNTLLNKRVTLRIYTESASINNQNAAIHNSNYNNVYYNNERAHSNDVASFAAVDPTRANTYSLFWEGSQNVSIATGEGLYVDFKLDERFLPYSWQSGYNVPVQFSAMRFNVTPRYLFVISADSTNDLDNTNNYYSKYARFYVKKSRYDMLVSATNTFRQINTSTGNPYNIVKNADFVAGRLNSDSLIAGLAKLNLHNTNTEGAQTDFDVIDRNVWDYRNIDYTIYKTLFISDDLEKNANRWATNRYDTTLRLFREQWFTRDLIAFLENSTPSSKNNLIISSEEFITDIYKDLFTIGELNQILSNDSTINISFSNDDIRISYLNEPLRKANLTDSLNKILVRNYFNVEPVYDSLDENGPYVWNSINYQWEYIPVTPLYQQGTVIVGAPPVAKPGFVSLPYKFADTNGTITGGAILNGYSLEIKPTGWAWEVNDSSLVDQPPYGTIYKPIDNLLGNQAIGAVLDTMKYSQIVDVSSIPQNQRIISLCQSTLDNNIILLGFDWRHYGDISALLNGIFDYNSRNSSTEGDPTLPISFYGFDAYPINNRVELTWNTANKSAINQFDVERTQVHNTLSLVNNNFIDKNINNFELVESVAAQNNNKDNAYHLTDRNLDFGSTYVYRLKLIDTDGMYTYTDNKIVNIENSEFNISDITPQPVALGTIAEFTVTSDMTQHLNIAVYDLTGKEILVLHNGILNSGNNRFEINSTNLTAGTYTVSVGSAKQTLIKAFTVVK